MLYGVYRLAGYEWLRWDGPLTREEAEKLAAYRQEQYGDTFKADVLDTDWDEGYSTTPEPAAFFIAESKRRAVYDDEDQPDEEWWEGF